MSNWRNKMPESPKLAHSDGAVVVVLGERSVVFPSEADARFFHEAYTLVPALENEVATLRTEIDEGRLHTALARAKQLQEENAKLLKENADLQERVGTEVQRRTEATRRATILAKGLIRCQSQQKK